MRSEDTAPQRNSGASADQPPLVAIGAAVFAVLLAGSALLWARFGESVYVERILGAIASCF
jgi:hypothetical protein